LISGFLFGQQNNKKVVLTSNIGYDINYSIYPNPLNKGSRVSLNFFSKYNIAMIVTVTDLLGNVVIEKNIDATAGRNKYFLDTNDLKQGIYFLHIFDGGEREVHRFIVK